MKSANLTIGSNAGRTLALRRERKRAGNSRASADANCAAPRMRAAPTRAPVVCQRTKARHAATMIVATPNTRQPGAVSNAVVKMLTRGAFGPGPSADEAGASRVRRVWAIGTLVFSAYDGERRLGGRFWGTAGHTRRACGK